MVKGLGDNMKLIFIIGSGAVGKMTVGQELTKITNLKLFHNHMIIEPVLEVFGEFNGNVIKSMREIIFKEFAKSNNYGLIFTYMWAFDSKEDWEYIESVKSLFNNTEFYYVELVCDKEERLKRNVTENRLLNKKSKRDIIESNRKNNELDDKFRLVSNDGEIKFDNYIRINNTNIKAEDVALLIKKKFYI